MNERDTDEARWSNWLERAQNGDSAAYNALLTELAGALRGYLLSRFGRLENLDDCVQDVLLAVHQARHTYDPARPLRPWLFAIARNRTIDLMRRGGQPSDPLDDRVLERTSAEFEPIPAIDTGRLMRALSKNLRDTLILTKLMGYTTRECAARQGVSESVVKIRVHRGIRKLRALCDSEYDAGVP